MESKGLETSSWRLHLRLNDEPTIRKGVHNKGNRQRDLGGRYSLLSDHFYYFGVEAKPLPTELKQVIKKNQGYKKIEKSRTCQRV